MAQRKSINLLTNQDIVMGIYANYILQGITID